MLYTIVTLVGLIGGAFAADFSQPLTDMDGKELKEGETVVTLGIIAANALLAPYVDEKELTGEEKVKRFLLATKVRGAKEVVLSVEEVALIKKLVAKGYPPLVVGKSWQMLDPASVGK